MFLQKRMPLLHTYLVRATNVGCKSHILSKHLSRDFAQIVQSNAQVWLSISHCNHHLAEQTLASTLAIHLHQKTHRDYNICFRMDKNIFFLSFFFFFLLPPNSCTKKTKRKCCQKNQLRQSMHKRTILTKKSIP